MKTKATIIIIAVGILGILGASASGNKTAPLPLRLKRSSTAVQTGSNAPSSSTSAALKDGTYTGGSEDTPYGIVQVAAVVSGGKITDIQFLQMPFDQGHSREVTAFAEPQLKAMAISNQSAQIDFVSGATDTSIGFEHSLQAALDQAAQA